MEATDKTEDRNVDFVRLRIRGEYGPALYTVYYVKENGRSYVMECFRSLNEEERGNIIALISRMATVRNFKSGMINHRLANYSYGELTPHPHRFFFFQKYSNYIIFFSYVLKKKNKLKDSFYRSLEKEKVFYEREFEKFLRRRNR